MSDSPLVDSAMPQGTLVDDLIASYAIPKETFEIPLNQGHIFVFRAVTSAGELAEIRDKAIAANRVFWDEKGNTMPGPWSEFRPPSVEEAVQIYMLFATCEGVRPKDGEIESLTHRDWCVFAHRVPSRFIQIRTIWNQFQSDKAIWDMVEESKRLGESLNATILESWSNASVSAPSGSPGENSEKPNPEGFPS